MVLKVERQDLFPGNKNISTVRFVFDKDTKIKPIDSPKIKVLEEPKLKRF